MIEVLCRIRQLETKMASNASLVPTCQSNELTRENATRKALELREKRIAELRKKKQLEKQQFYFYVKSKITVHNIIKIYMDEINYCVEEPKTITLRISTKQDTAFDYYDRGDSAQTDNANEIIDIACRDVIYELTKLGYSYNTYNYTIACYGNPFHPLYRTFICNFSIDEQKMQHAARSPPKYTSVFKWLAGKLFKNSG